MAQTPLNLSSANALVCGASGGLGSRIGKRLKEAGASVTAVGRNADRLHATTADQHLLLDLRTPEACRQAVQTASSFGSLDVVVNAVGLVAFGAVADLTIDAMEELFLTNTFVPIMLSQAALPSMNKGGVIVQISGVIAEQNLPGMAAYGASKAALKAFDDAFGREARRVKVRVLDVRPPHTETGLSARAIEGTAPKMPEGLTPDAVADRIVAAIADGTTDLPAAAFH